MTSFFKLLLLLLLLLITHFAQIRIVRYQKKNTFFDVDGAPMGFGSLILIVYVWLLCLFALVSRDTDGCLLAFWFPSNRGLRSRSCSEAFVAFCGQGTRLVDLLVCWRAKTDKELKWKNKSDLSVSKLCLNRRVPILPDWVKVQGPGLTAGAALKN